MGGGGEGGRGRPEKDRTTDNDLSINTLSAVRIEGLNTN